MSRKSFLVAVLAFCCISSATNAAQIFYCIDKDRIGFEPQANHEVRNYNLDRFKILVDFENRTMVSSELYIKEDNSTCMTYWDDNDILYCFSDYGSAFAISKKTMKFHYSNIFIQHRPSDSILIAHGHCERF